MTVLVCTALMPGCPQAQTPEGRALPPVGAFAVSYQRSGGLAASSESLVVTRGGHAIAESSGTRAGDRHVEFRLGARRIRLLQRALDRADLGSIAQGPNGGCADCYLYSISYEGDRAEFDQSTIPPRLEIAISEIEAIIAAHTIPPNARA